MTDSQHEVLIGALMDDMNTQTRAHGPRDGLAALRTIANRVKINQINQKYKTKQTK